MASLDARRFDEPDEIVELPFLRQEIVVLGEVHVARTTHEPGWRWSEHVQPVVGTPSCLHHHQGVVLSGSYEVRTNTGARRVLRPGDAYDIPPGHDAWVVGDEPAIVIEFTGVRGWGKSPDTAERLLATLLVTDIVDSTAVAASLGDALWKELLARHGERTRRELDRFRGHEITTTGDGFLAIFDGATRAVRCAAAIRDAARLDELEIRAGVHTGEVEREAGNVRGVAVHAATRIASLGGPGEVLVSAQTADLLEGSGIPLEDAGEHELKGLPGRRRVHRLASD